MSFKSMRHFVNGKSWHEAIYDIALCKAGCDSGSLPGEVLLELSFTKDQRSWQGREYWGSCEEVMDSRRGVTGRWGRASRGGAAGSLQLGLEHSGGHQSCINILLVVVV